MTSFKFCIGLVLCLQVFSLELKAEDNGLAEERKIATTCCSIKISDEMDESLLAREKTPKNWRNNWFVQNILLEVPIIGDCCCSPDAKVVLQRIGKSTVMLVGGTVGMMLYIVDPSDNCMSSNTNMNMNMNMNNMTMTPQHMSSDNMALQGTEMAVNMAIGMAAANIFYNVSLNGCCFVYKKIKKRCNFVGPEILD